MNIDMDNSTPFEWNVVTLLGTLMRNVGGVVGAVSQQTEALERIATALEREPSAGVGGDERPDVSEWVEIDADARVLTEDERTDHVTALFADGGLRGTVTSWHENGTAGFYLSGDDDLAVATPEELHALAERLRTIYADALDTIAAIWAEGRDNGGIPTKVDPLILAQRDEDA